MWAKMQRFLSKFKLNVVGDQPDQLGGRPQTRLLFSNATKRWPVVKRWLAAVSVLLSRTITILPNFSLVGGFNFANPSLVALIVPVVGFDLLWGGFYPGFIFTYLGFFSYYFLGKLADGNYKKQLAFLPLASIVFFLTSNFGVWLYWYQPSWEGLIKCYTLALPFFRNTLLGDCFFGCFLVIIKQLQSRRQIVAGQSELILAQAKNHSRADSSQTLLDG